MKTDKQLDREIKEAIALGCEVDINAYDDADAAKLTAMLKGRHGGKLVGVRRADPCELVPIMDRVRGFA